jgi:hypothetical protein
VKVYVAAALEALMNKERHDETQFTTKIVGKFSLGPSYYRFVKFSFPVYTFDALLCRNWLFALFFGSGYAVWTHKVV